MLFKKNFLIFALLIFLLSPVGGAERSGDQGFGFALGNPTGITAKIWMDRQWALEGNLGAQGGELAVHGNLLFHNFGLLKNSKSGSELFAGLLRHGELPVYFGVGPKIIFEDHEELGVRFPVGLAFFPNNSDWELFAEFAPVLRMTPSAGMNGDFGVGVRYYFKAIRPTETE